MLLAYHRETELSNQLGWFHEVQLNSDYFRHLVWCRDVCIQTRQNRIVHISRQ